MNHNSNLEAQNLPIKVGSNVMLPERLLPDVVYVHSHQLGSAGTAAYASWNRERGMQWCALGGAGAAHSEALRDVSGGLAAVHPTLGWDQADLDRQAGCVVRIARDEHAISVASELMQRYGVASVAQLELALLDTSLDGWGKVGSRVRSSCNATVWRVWGQLVQFERCDREE